MCKNLDSPHPLTPSPKDERRGTRIMSPLSQRWERGWGVREKIADYSPIDKTQSRKSWFTLSGTSSWGQ
jgi:hypothetical protein